MATGRIRGLIPVGYADAPSVAVGARAVWTVNGLGVVRIDPATNIPLPITINGTDRGASPTALAVSDRAVWVANRFIVSGVFASGKRGTVSRIDPQTNAVVATITVGHEPFAIAAGYGAVWVTNRTDSTIMRIDPRTNKVVKTIHLGGTPEGLAVGPDTLWVSVD